jgi:minichromosome maintenance protein 10
LYSVVRLEATRQAYEVPVEGDWVTIAVVAERGDVKLTAGAGNAANRREFKQDPEDEVTTNNGKAGNKEKGKEKKEGGDRWKRRREEEDEDDSRKGGKKYVNLKLIDLGHRSRAATSSSSAVARGTLRGDAQLTLLLFEADCCDKLKKMENGKENVTKVWRGGSGGAFEECFARLKEGTVIALLNPKVLKPFQVRAQNSQTNVDYILIHRTTRDRTRKTLPTPPSSLLALPQPLLLPSSATPPTWVNVPS